MSMLDICGGSGSDGMSIYGKTFEGISVGSVVGMC